MSELKTLLNIGYPMQLSAAKPQIVSSGIIPAQYTPFSTNATTPHTSLVLGIVDRYVLQHVELALHDLLWRPDRFMLHILLSAWTLFTTSPPLIRLSLSYLIFRYTIYSWILWAKQDYQRYLDLGRGGSSPDLWGWWRVTRLKFTANVDVLDPPHVPPLLEPYRGILWKLPSRPGSRPVVEGIAPQRQINQKTPISTFERLSDMLADFAETHPEHLRINCSFLEGCTSALKLNDPSAACETTKTGIPATAGEYGFEICHPHRQDGSMHLIMHPEDIRSVIEAGWGQRHPLATNAWYWRLWYHGIRRIRTPVPEYLVFVYAPRNEGELEIVYRLVRAAVWFATKKVLDAKVGRHRPVARSSTR